MSRTAGITLLAGALAVVFAYNVQQHRFLGDDAFISFRYARHLANGEGLTWNPGERVEGYTNFLWVVLIAGAMRVGVQPEVVAVTLGIGAGVLVLGGLVVFTARLSSLSGLLVLAPTAALASSRTFTAWCTGGLETMLFTLLVCSGAWVAIEERRRGARIRVASAVLLGAAALTRPEGLLFGGVCGVWILGNLVWDRRTVGPFLLWVAVFGAITGAHFLWRHEYYGAWVPNTFTAKVPEPWWGHGVKYLWLFTRAYGLPLFAPVVAVALLKHPDRDRALIGATILIYTTYVVAVGGDRFEFRFWIPVLPFCTGSSSTRFNGSDCRHRQAQLSSHSFLASRCTARSSTTTRSYRGGGELPQSPESEPMRTGESKKDERFAASSTQATWIAACCWGLPEPGPCRTTPTGRPWTVTA